MANNIALRDPMVLQAQLSYKVLHFKMSHFKQYNTMISKEDDNYY